MKYKVTNNFDNVGGTSLKEHINVTYGTLVELFGEPVESDGYKVSCEWVFESDDGKVFTLYDWKATSLYDEGLPTVEEFRADKQAQTFHIGGHSDATEFKNWLWNKLSNRLFMMGCDQ